MERHLHQRPFSGWWPFVVLIAFSGLERSLPAQFPITRDYSRSGITDDELARLVDVPNLEELSVGERQITDARLAPISKLTGLKSLRLERTSITDAALAQLVGLTEWEMGSGTFLAASKATWARSCQADSLRYSVTCSCYVLLTGVTLRTGRFPACDITRAKMEYAALLCAAKQP